MKKILAVIALAVAPMLMGAVCNGDPSDPTTICCTRTIVHGHCYWYCTDGSIRICKAPKVRTVVYDDVAGECYESECGDVEVG